VNLACIRKEGAAYDLPDAHSASSRPRAFPHYPTS
jgi:hypothetical protein